MGAIRNGQRGQSSIEYVAVLAVVAAVVTALVLVNPGIGQSVASSIQVATCRLFQSGCGDPGLAGGPADPDARDGSQEDPGDYAIPYAGAGSGLARLTEQLEEDPEEYAGIYDDVGGPAQEQGDPADNPLEWGGQFAQGFAAQMWDELLGVKDTVVWIWNSITDDETQAQNAALWDLFREDPLGFGWTVLQGLWEPIQAEIDSGKPASAVGRTVAMILAAVFGGKGLTKLRQVDPDVDAFLNRMGPDAEEQIRRLGDDRPDGPDAPGSPCLANSFLATTPVLLADGSALPIAQIRPGVQVLAADPVTGELGPRPVTDLITGSGLKELVEVGVAAGTVTATAGHPFYLADRGWWVEAGKLRVGDSLLTAGGGEVAVQAVAQRTAVTTVHNLTVADLHTYFVLAGDQPLLVHNQTRGPCSTIFPSGGPGPGQIDVEHIFHGAINKRGNAVGYHHRGSIGGDPHARVVPGTETPKDAFGVYRAKVEVYDEATGRWVAKGPASSFFPDDWSRQRVLDEIRSAQANGTVTGNRFEGVSSSGVTIQGYLGPNGGIATAFPVLAPIYGPPIPPP